MSGLRGARIPVTEISGLLAQSLGREKAVAVVDDSRRALGLRGTDVDRDEALRILEHLATQAGLVGIVARFAKAHAILLFT